METDLIMGSKRLKWFGLTVAGVTCALCLLWLALPAAGFAQEDGVADDGAWVAKLGRFEDLNEKEPGQVKAEFLNADGELMDIEKVYVRWEMVNSKTGRWVVLSAIDTYMKCKVEYKPGDCCFRDPCYGSEYDLEGHVTKGPAKQDLPDYSDLAYVEDGQLLLKRYPPE